MEFHEKAISLYIIGLLQFASKRVLSGSDCLKIDGGLGFAPDPTAGACSAPPDPLTAFNGSILLRKGRGRRGSERKETREENGWGREGMERNW